MHQVRTPRVTQPASLSIQFASTHCVTRWLKQIMVISCIQFVVHSKSSWLRCLAVAVRCGASSSFSKLYFETITVFFLPFISCINIFARTQLQGSRTTRRILSKQLSEGSRTADKSYLAIFRRWRSSNERTADMVTTHAMRIRLFGRSSSKVPGRDVRNTTYSRALS